MKRDELSWSHQYAIPYPYPFTSTTYNVGVLSLASTFSSVLINVLQIISKMACNIINIESGTKEVKILALISFIILVCNISHLLQVTPGVFITSFRRSLFAPATTGGRRNVRW